MTHKEALQKIANMKAEELRIGNWVEIDQYGNTRNIIRIDSGSDIDQVVKLRPSPISLSPEILEKCGFENYQELNSDFNENGFWVMNGIVILQSYLTANFHYSYLANDDDSLSMGLEIKSLQQLQNLYYALCGEELTFKTPNN